MGGRLRVRCFSVSLDGYAAGPGQDLQNPLGVRGAEMFAWFFKTRTWFRMHPEIAAAQGGGTGAGGGGAPAPEPGETGVNDGFAATGFDGIGAWILGRNMFGPVRGPWADGSWRGWWGEEPPYHCPVFVLTHFAREPLLMKGGTEFRFVTDGIESALRQAREAAGGKDVRLGGGVATVREYLAAGLVDDLHLAVSPVLLGGGEHLFHGIDLHELGYGWERSVAGEHGVVHVLLRKRE